MDRLPCRFPIAGLLAEVLLAPVSSQAQYTTSDQTNIISGIVE
jgi:hypothetical protein